MPENSTIIPRQNTAAWNTLSRRVADGLFRKNDMVIGIIGKTQGVKIASKPAPNAKARKGVNPCSSGLGAEGAAEAGAPGLNSEKPGGMEIAGAGALGSMVSEAL